MGQKHTLSDAEWQKRLTLEQYHILRKKGTEPPFSGRLLKVKEPGIYRCAGCGSELFSSDSKFDSGSGWPSFDAPISPQSVTLKQDTSHGMNRIEVLCSQCGGHLGHVFHDGPTKTGQRYCINSAALSFEKTIVQKTEQATFGAGCFWHVEETFRKIPGVLKTTVGYMGGSLQNPTYEDVCTDRTGHAEVVHLEFDPTVISYEQLLDVFWSIHDPTTKNRQGPDTGTQYRSVIFYHTSEQKKIAEQSLQKIEQAKKYARPIVTEITAASTFYPAEEYHQKYLMKRGLSRCQL
ncbi:MAG: bifunctional methionine sulfoxide reductase B/A protein [Candidatus Thermoplasmatota archaeon]